MVIQNQAGTQVEQASKEKESQGSNIPKQEEDPETALNQKATESKGMKVNKNVEVKAEDTERENEL